MSYKTRKLFGMKRTLTLLLLLLCSIVLVKGQWSNNPAINTIICNLSGEQAIPKVAVCPDGSYYIGYFSSESGNYNVRLQRLDAQGNILWASNGILISNNQQDTWLTDWDMTADQSNHAILAFNDIRDGSTNVYAYRISPTGTFVWGANGVTLSSNTNFNAAPKVIVTNAGNAIVAWMSGDYITMQKINASGTLQWGANGITLTTTNRNTWPQMLPIGADDFFMKYYEDTGVSWSPTRHIYVQRFGSSGAAVWASPLAISTAGGISGQNQILPFISDNNGGFYLAVDDDRDNNLFNSTFIQHCNSSGVLTFPTNGVEVCTTPGWHHWYPKIACPVGSTDVYVFWNEIDGNQNIWGIYGQKISSSGARTWGDAGKVFIPTSSTDYYPMFADKVENDVVLFIEQYTTSINTMVKAMRINPSGDFVWTPSMASMSTYDSQKIHTDFAPLANNQWVAAWEDTRGSSSDIYAQNLSMNGTNGPLNYGTISGQITLNGGYGNVTDVTIQAGTNSTHPNASGFYTISTLSGNYTVTATLSGYNSASQSNVAVLTNQTTTVNLTLNAIPVGKIEGTVSLLNGSGIITMVEVRAGSVSTHPDASGNYTLMVSPGSHQVIASLPYYLNDTVNNVVVTNNNTTPNINLELELAPTTGTVTGTVTLTGGTGDVTQVLIDAAGTTTHPNASGFYSLVAPVGNIDVYASLSGYATQYQFGVGVIGGQTTSNVDFNLVSLGSTGTITGHVTINGTSQDVTLTTITAGNYITNPDMSGNYQLVVPAGNYEVTASHPYTETQSLSNILVTLGSTTSNVDFQLNVNRTDMIVTITDQWSYFLTGGSFSITGPEATYTGENVMDTVVIPAVLYGTYTGTAMWNMGTVPLEDEINANNNEMHFIFILEGISEIDSKVVTISPNPVSNQSIVKAALNDQSNIQVSILSYTGGLLAQKVLSGNDLRVGINLNDLIPVEQLANGLYILKLDQRDKHLTQKFILSR